MREKSNEEVHRELTQLHTTMQSREHIVSGRGQWAIVSRHDASGNSGQVLYDFNHLQGLNMINGNIEGFHNTWIMVVSELETRPDEKLLPYLYSVKLRASNRWKLTLPFTTELNGTVVPSTPSNGSGMRPVDTFHRFAKITCRTLLTRAYLPAITRLLLPREKEMGEARKKGRQEAAQIGYSEPSAHGWWSGKPQGHTSWKVRRQGRQG